MADMKRRSGRPVVGRRLASGVKVREEDVERYDTLTRMVSAAPLVRCELRGGRMFVVKRLPDAVPR